MTGLVEARDELAIDHLRNSPATVNECRIEVDASRAGGEHRLHVGPAHHAAIALDRNAAAGNGRGTRYIRKRGLERGATMQGPLPCAQSGLGHRPAARDLQALDPRGNAELDQLGQAVGHAGGVVGHAHDRGLAAIRDVRKHVPQQRELVEGLTRLEIRTHQADLDRVHVRRDGRETLGDLHRSEATDIGEQRAPGAAARAQAGQCNSHVRGSAAPSNPPATAFPDNAPAAGTDCPRAAAA